MQVTTAAELIKALGGGKHDGMCRCPAHNDKTPSLHISSDRHGKVLFHCFVGCSQQQVLAAMKSRGINLSRNTSETIFNPQPQKSERKERQQKFREQARPILWSAMQNENVASRRHAYKTQTPTEYLRCRVIDSAPPCAMLLSREAATALGNRIVGFKPYPAMVCPIIGPKGFQGVSVTYLTRDATKNLRGKSKKNIRRINGSRDYGYVQLGLIDADNPPDIVIVAEGIETALSASQLTGHPAIAVLGANNFKKITPPSCGEIIIAADNNKVGRDAAQAAAEQWAAGRKVRIAVPTHKDWNDAHRDGNADPAKLRESILNGEQATANNMVQAVGMEQFMSLQFPPREFLLKPWLTTTGLHMIDAKAGHGKTWLTLSVAYAVASGQPLLDWEVMKRGKVLYVDGELPGNLLQARLRMLGPPLPETDFAVLSRSQFEMRGAMMLDLGTQAGRDLLNAEIERLGINLIILDSVITLVRSVPEGSNDNVIESWRAIQDWSLRHRGLGRAVIYLHRQDRSGNPLGTSTREVVLDARIKMAIDEAASNDDESAFKLEFGKAREFYGADRAPLLAYLSTKSGTVEWRREGLKKPEADKREEIEELLKSGMSPADIAKNLKVTRQYQEMGPIDLSTATPA